MGKETEARMPRDWNDWSGWDDYYQFELNRRDGESEPPDLSSFRLEQLPGLAEDLKSQGWRDLWVPGCGLSPLARLLAHLGLQVVATDLSRVAIEFQQSERRGFEDLALKLGPPDPAGTFAAALHDFRTPFRTEAFDLILNVKAFQGFRAEDMAGIAAVHAESLRKGRSAYFDTINVQGERRDQMEQTLEDGGFVVPFAKLNRWYRNALRETGISHVFVLGRPIVPWGGPGGMTGKKRDRAMERLQKISAEYQSRLDSERISEEKRIGADSKMAHVIYSTG
jgi:SAM-dependent methyltransferase